MQGDLKPLLGEARAADLTRSQSEDYRTLCTVAEQFDLPAATSQTLMDIRQVAEEERQKPLADPQILESRRREALMVIQN